MKKFLMIGALLLSGSVVAENWYDIGKSSTGLSQFFIDLDTIQSVREYPYLSVVVQPTYLKGHELRKKGIYYNKEQWYISCDDNSSFVRAYILYGLKDEVLDSWQHKYSINKHDFQYAFPNTMADAVIKSACSYYKTGYPFSTFQPPELKPNFEEFKKQFEK